MSEIFQMAKASQPSQTAFRTNARTDARPFAAATFNRAKLSPRAVCSSRLERASQHRGTVRGRFGFRVRMRIRHKRSSPQERFFAESPARKLRMVHHPSLMCKSASTELPQAVVQRCRRHAPVHPVAPISHTGQQQGVTVSLRRDTGTVHRSTDRPDTLPPTQWHPEPRATFARKRVSLHAVHATR